MKIKKAHIGTMLLAITLVTGMSTAYADEDNSHPAPSGVQPAQPAPASSHSTDRKAMKAADRTLARNVRKAIVKAGDVDISRVGVTAHSGKVTLSGAVPQEDQIALAAQHARAVAGVKNVSNWLRIEVQGGN